MLNERALRHSSFVEERLDDPIAARSRKSLVVRRPAAAHARLARHDGRLHASLRACRAFQDDVAAEADGAAHRAGAHRAGAEGRGELPQGQCATHRRADPRQWLDSFGGRRLAAPAPDGCAGLPSLEDRELRGTDARGGGAIDRRLGRRRHARRARRRDTLDGVHGRAHAVRRRRLGRGRASRSRSGRCDGRVRRLLQQPLSDCASAAHDERPAHPARGATAREGGLPLYRRAARRARRRCRRQRPADDAAEGARRAGRHGVQRARVARHGDQPVRRRLRDERGDARMDLLPVGAPSRNRRAGATRSARGHGRWTDRHGTPAAARVHRKADQGEHACLPRRVAGAARSAARRRDRRLAHRARHAAADLHLPRSPRCALVSGPRAFRPRALGRRLHASVAQARLPAVRRRPAHLHRQRLRDARPDDHDRGGDTARALRAGRSAARAAACELHAAAARRYAPAVRHVREHATEEACA